MSVIVLDRWPKQLLHGSLRDVECDQTVAIDPGRSWTGMIARSGTCIIGGATVGLNTRTMARDDVPAIEDWAAWIPYWEDVADEADKLIDLLDRSRPIRIVTESMTSPSIRTPRGFYLPLKDWAPVYGLIGVLMGRFSKVYVVKPQSLGGRHQSRNGGTGDQLRYYAPQLCGKRQPRSWRNDHPNRTTQHVQSASDLAAIRQLMMLEVETDVRHAMQPSLEVAA